MISFLESLEQKIAPASFSFIDVDGDQVTVTTSKGTNDQLAAALTLLSRNGGDQLGLIDFTTNSIFQGTSLTVTAKPGVAGGNASVNVGQIQATGLDLGNITIRGDLGRLESGDSNLATAGLGTLTVESLGRLDNTTGAIGNAVLVEGDVKGIVVRGSIVTADISVQGNLKKLDVAGRVQSSEISAEEVGTLKVGGDFSGSHFDVGKLGTALIMGDLTAAVGGVSDNGFLELGEAKKIEIRGDMVGLNGLVGGSILVTGKVGSIVVGGSLIGGDSGDSGGNAFIRIGQEVGSMTVRGDILGGAGENTGRILVDGDLGGGSGNLKSLVIGGSILGGAGDGSGVVDVDGKMDTVRIGGSIQGGSGNGSGSLDGPFGIASFTLQGSLIGGSGEGSGAVRVDDVVKKMVIGGDVRGGSGDFSGALSTNLGNGGSLLIAGSLVGGSGVASGSILGPGTLQSLVIGGNVLGGDGLDSGVVNYGDVIRSVLIKGSIMGGLGVGSGALEIDADSPNVKITKFQILGDLIGGVGAGSGQVALDDLSVTQMSIGGSIRGGTGDHSGHLKMDDVSRLTIGGNIVGASASGVAVLSEAGFVGARNIGTMTVGGSVIAGVDQLVSGLFRSNGAIRVTENLGSLSIGGSLQGNATAQVLITAGGDPLDPVKPNNLAIGKITVLGNVERTSILAGYGQSGNPLFNGEGAVNADAQIGTVTIKGSLLASNIAAGVATGANNRFGDGNDVAMSGAGVSNDPTLASRIGAVIVGGQTDGTIASGDSFGISAQEIVKLSIGGVKFVLDPGPSDVINNFFIGTPNASTAAGLPFLNDFVVQEVP